MPKPSSQPTLSKAAILTVGDGRGFVVNCRHERLVITAAHCLPFFPPCHGASYLSERTYGLLLAPLWSKPAVRAECLFADPIADIAVLGSPDNQELSDQADAYEALMESVIPLTIADAPEKGHGWLLSLEGEWFACTLKYLKRVDGPIYISDQEQPIAGGMSGSPIINDNRSAIGIVCLSSGRNPRLMRDLPAWLLRAQASTPRTEATRPSFSSREPHC